MIYNIEREHFQCILVMYGIASSDEVSRKLYALMDPRFEAVPLGRYLDSSCKMCTWDWSLVM
jgi:hypothetical protein